LAYVEIVGRLGQEEEQRLASYHTQFAIYVSQATNVSLFHWWIRTNWKLHLSSVIFYCCFLSFLIVEENSVANLPDLVKCRRVLLARSNPLLFLQNQA